MSSLNQADYFPALNIELLKLYANSWVEKFLDPPIFKIVLWRYYHERFRDHKIYTKYAIVFTTDKNNPDLDYAVKSSFLRVLSKSDIKGLEVGGQFREEVYLEKSEKYCLREWQFFIKHVDDFDFERKCPGIKDKEPHVVLYPEVEKPLQQSIRDEKRVFPCNPGTQWDQIEIALLPSGEKYMVKTPIGCGNYDHIDLKLHKQNTKSRKPGALWVFLNELAKRDGFFPLEGVHNFENLSSNAKRLNKHLKQLFGIKESIYKDRCDRIGGYETKFKISSNPDDTYMVNRKSLIDEELEDLKYSNIKKSSYYPENSTFEKE